MGYVRGARSPSHRDSDRIQEGRVDEQDAWTHLAVATVTFAATLPTLFSLGVTPYTALLIGGAVAILLLARVGRRRTRV